MVMAHMEGMEEHKVGKFLSTSDGRVLDCEKYGSQVRFELSNYVLTKTDHYINIGRDTFTNEKGFIVLNKNLNDELNHKISQENIHKEEIRRLEEENLNNENDLIKN